MPEHFAMYIQEQDKAFVTIPFFNSTVLKSYRLLVLIVILIGIIKEVLKIIYGRWTLHLAIINAVISLVSVSLIALLILDPEIWNPHLVQDFQTHMDVTWNVQQAKTTVIHAVVAIMIISTVIEQLVIFYKTIVYNRQH